MIQNRVPARLRLSLFWLCLSVLLVLALLPAPPQTVTGWDKANHALAFALLAVLGRWSYPGGGAPLLLGLLAYGGLIEALQSLTPSRSAEWGDLLADAVGLGLGWLLMRILEGPAGLPQASAARSGPPTP